MTASPAPRIKPRHRLEYGVFYIAQRLLVGARTESARRAGRLIGRIGYRLGSGWRGLALDGLATTFPDLDATERETIARECFEHYGSVMCEALGAGGFDARTVRERFDFDGWHHLEQARAAGRGAMLVSGHYGTWELSIYPVALRLGSLGIVARPQNNPLVRREDARRRERFGITMLPRKRLGYAMLKTLRAGNTLALVIDQRVLPQNGMIVPFLGRPAWTTPLPAQVSVLSGAPALPVICLRKPRGRYLVRIGAPIHPTADEIDGGQGGLVHLTRRMIEPLEQTIREQPELWLWMHRRWKLTHRHGHATSFARVRSQSGIEPGPGVADIDRSNSCGDALRDLATTRSLEGSRYVVLLGDAPEARLAAAMAVANTLLKRGHTVALRDANALADDLRDAPPGNKRAALLARWDLWELLILTIRAEDLADPNAAADLTGLLEARRGRRATLLLPDFDPRGLVPSGFETIVSGAGAQRDRTPRSGGDAAVLLDGGATRQGTGRP